MDIERYRDRNSREQHEAQQALAALLNDTASRAGFDPAGLSIQWSGDGGFAVLPAGVPSGEVTERFIEELHVALANRNARRRPTPWTHIRLRLSVHEGPIRMDGATGRSGPPAVEVTGLVNADPLRAALAACPGAYLGVIVSARIFDDYLNDGYGSLSPAEFRPVRVSLKGHVRTAYVYVPGIDLFAIGELDHYDPDRAEAGDGDAGGAAAAPPEGAQRIVYGSAHTITDSNVSETHQGDINVGGVSFGGSR
ncbi:hypothetical protein [Spongiactinospora sp. 9N601]|uniref:hypothetical protein n=1 Tax=Spongiactinospora sp. 9N601 TaxID=3375149 RepID=UPI0037B16AD7